MGNLYNLKKGVAALEDLVNGTMVSQLLAGAKTVYYVDGNSGSDSRSGKGGFDNARKTLASTLALSHADISSGAKGWASRNAIVIKGDSFEEDLVSLAQKTTIIGVGSCDGNGSARIKGVQTITGTWNGTWFVNVDFEADADTTVMMTLPTTCGGIEFYGCSWLPGAATTIGLQATSVTGLKVKACEFKGWWNAGFDTAAISLPAGVAHGQIIERCRIDNQAGIGIAAAATAGGNGCFISDNDIYASTLGIDDDSDNFFTLRNHIISDAVTLAGAIDVNAAKALHNYLAAGTALNQLYPPNDVSE